MIKLNSKLMLASTALVSAMTVSGYASAITTDNAVLADDGTNLVYVDVDGSTTVNTGDTILTSATTASLTAGTANQITVDTAGVAVTVDAAVTTNDGGDAHTVIISADDTTLTLNSGVTITNAEADAGTGAAINLTGSNTTLNISGTLTSAANEGILTGDVSSTINVLTGGSAGIIDASAADTAGATTTINVTGTAGAITTGDAGSTITVTGGTTGTITGAAGIDALTISGSTASVTGAIDLDAGADTITINSTNALATNSTIASIDGGAGADTMTVSSGYTTVTGALDNVETLLVSGGTLNVSGALGATDLDDLTVSSGATLSVTGATGIDASATIAGTMNQTGAAAVGGNLDITGTYSGANNLAVTGNTTVSGTLTEAGTFASNDLTVSGTATVTGAATIGGDVVASGTYTQTGASTIAGDLTVAGTYAGGANTAVTGDTVVSGTLTEAGTFGSNDLTVSGTATITGAATIADELIITSTGTATLTANSTVATSLTVASGGTLNIAGDVTGVDMLDIAAGSNVVVGKAGSIQSVAGAANVNNATIEIDGAGAFGTIEITAAESLDFTSSQVGIKIAQGVDINDLDGDSFAAIVQGGAAAVSSSTGITSTNGLLTYTWTVTGNDYNLATDLTTAGVTTLAGAATTGNNTNVATVIDTTALASLYTEVLASSDVNTALESLSADVSGGATAAAIGTSVASTGTVSNRLALLRGTDNGRSGMVAGQEMMANRGMWIQAFGTTAEQDTRDGVKGYDATSNGLAIGADTDELIDGARVGVAFSYATADVESDAANKAETDLESYQVTAYASHNLENGVYLDGTIGYSFGTNDTQRTALGNVYTGEYDSNQFSVSAEVGKSYDWKATKVTPFVGFNYINVDSDDYNEVGNGGAALSINSDDVSAFLISFGSDIEWNIQGSDGSTYMPYLRAKYSYDAIADEVETSSSFLAGGTAFASKGASVAESTLGLGAGVNVITAEGFEFTAAYDAEIKQDFLAHTGMLQARWAF